MPDEKAKLAAREAALAAREQAVSQREDALKAIEEEHRRRDNDLRIKEVRAHRLTAWATVALAVMTLLLFASTGFLAGFTWNLAGYTKSLVEAEGRAHELGEGMKKTADESNILHGEQNGLIGKQNGIQIDQNAALDRLRDSMSKHADEIEAAIEEQKKFLSLQQELNKDVFQEVRKTQDNNAELEFFRLWLDLVNGVMTPDTRQVVVQRVLEFYKSRNKPAEMRWTHFDGVDTRVVDLSNADLSFASFVGARFSDVQHITGSCMFRATFDPKDRIWVEKLRENNFLVWPSNMPEYGEPDPPNPNQLAGARLCKSNAALTNRMRDLIANTAAQSSPQ